MMHQTVQGWIMKAGWCGVDKLRQRSNERAGNSFFSDYKAICVVERAECGFNLQSMQSKTNLLYKNNKYYTKKCSITDLILNTLINKSPIPGRVVLYS